MPSSTDLPIRFRAIKRESSSMAAAHQTPRTEGLRWAPSLTIFDLQTSQMSCIRSPMTHGLSKTDTSSRKRQIMQVWYKRSILHHCLFTALLASLWSTNRPMLPYSIQTLSSQDTITDIHRAHSLPSQQPQGERRPAICDTIRMCRVFPPPTLPWIQRT